MDEYIKKRAAIDTLNKLDVSDGVGISSVACNLQEEAIRSIENLPSADVAPVRHGRWIRVGHLGRSYKCNQCGNYLNFDGVNAGRGSANYCPNCGARMDGDTDE